MESICPLCEEIVTQEEAVYKAFHPSGLRAIHYECELREVIGSVGHQKGTCVRGEDGEDDPPGMTKREAARAAAKYFFENRGNK